MKEGNGMDKESLVVLANKLMFTMDESEYDTLLEEFDIILKQMDLIGNIPDIENVEPLIYPIEKTFASFGDLKKELELNKKTIINYFKK